MRTLLQNTVPFAKRCRSPPGSPSNIAFPFLNQSSPRYRQCGEVHYADSQLNHHYSRGVSK